MNIPKKYYLLLGIGLILLVVIEALKPKEINWSPTYSIHDKIPFGTSAIYHLSKDLFPDKEIKTINETGYNYLIDNDSEFSMIYISHSTFFDEQSVEKILAFIHKGNEIFISSENIDPKILDSLHITTNFIYPDIGSARQITHRINDVEITYDSSEAFLNLDVFSYFEFPDSLNNEIEEIAYCNDKPNFIRVPFGKGNVFLHLEPYLFSNIQILKNKSVSYAEVVFIEMKNNDIVWDDYMNNGDRKHRSPFRVILQSVSLKYALYTTLIILLLFIVFSGRRKQKVIQVIKPPRNSSVDFINILTNLYLGQKNHKTISNHHINAFKLFLKKEYFIYWKDSSQSKIKKISAKVGIDEIQVENTINFIEKIEKKPEVNQSELLELTKLIQNITYKNYE